MELQKLLRFLTSFGMRNLAYSWSKTSVNKILFACLLLFGFFGFSSAQNKDSSSIKERTANIIDPVKGIKFAGIVAPYNLYLNQEYSVYLDRVVNNPDLPPIHSTFKPFITYAIAAGHDTSGHHSWLYRKLYQESFLIIHDTAEKFYCTIDPLFNFQGGIDHSDSNKKYYQNTRGILIQGNVGSKFAFSSTFWENQADYPYYVNQFIQENYVIPGNGRPKAFGTKGWDFSMSEAYLSFSSSCHFNFQAGYGKNFIGDGYRSLLLSDNSFAYPYIRITTTFWHLQYTNLYTEFMDPFADPTVIADEEGLFQRKAAAFQYLSWNIVPKVEFGIFQGMIWTAANQYNQQSFNANYFDPVIGVNALAYGLGNTNNVLLGSTIKYKINRNFMAYGQLLINNLPKDGGGMNSIYNQTGYQAGIKYFNKVAEIQLEYNQVRPYTYSNKDSLQNYSHYDQALGDPLGANFKELILMIHLRSRHFTYNLQLTHALEGLDSTGNNYGSNIFISTPRTNTTGVAMLQGIRSTLTYMDAHISYLMNPRTNMNITIGISRRTLSNSLNNEPASTLFYVGFRTSIENMYVDF